jgi:hypothetical protein
MHFSIKYGKLQRYFDIHSKEGALPIAWIQIEAPESLFGINEALYLSAHSMQSVKPPLSLTSSE